MQAQVEKAQLLSEKYVKQALEELKSRLHYNAYSKEDFINHKAIELLQFVNEKIPKSENISEILSEKLFLHFTNKSKLVTISQIESTTNFYYAHLEKTNQLDSYTLQLLEWLKKLEENKTYHIFFSDKSHIFYITHYIETLKKWLLAEDKPIKIILLIPENTKNLYSSTFAKQVPILNKLQKEDFSKIADNWKNFGFTEKAILITTCFLRGLSLHQFRQVISQVLKVKDQLEEKDKTDRKMQGFYMAKWEKNYDQILRNCQLRTIKNEGQPALIGFENPQDQLEYTQFIEEEYPIFLQEFFEILINAVFPKLCQDYQEVLKACIGMYARLAAHHKNYSQNLRPIELMVTLLNKYADQINKEKLGALLINELCLHPSITHLAKETFEFLANDEHEKILFLNTIAKNSHGQVLNFSLNYWLQLLNSEHEASCIAAFKGILDYSLENTTQLKEVIEALDAQKTSISFVFEDHLISKVPLYEIFLLYYSIENIKKQNLNNPVEKSLDTNKVHLPTNLLLAQSIGFSHFKHHHLEVIIENLFEPKDFLINTSDHLYIAALLIAEWYISLHNFSSKKIEITYDEAANNLLKLLDTKAFLAKNINRKKLINRWQEIAHDLLLLAKEIPHTEYQELMALNTKRKIIIKLINNFRNL